MQGRDGLRLSVARFGIGSKDMVAGPDVTDCSVAAIGEEDGRVGGEAVGLLCLAGLLFNLFEFPDELLNRLFHQPFFSREIRRPANGRASGFLR
ncbi:hypothetical protein GCM10010166_62650 [Couchioplanes caeruleus subsp. azureus]|nr:hypothetical protein GCM10010166_62650 [Couchioplanes caeruleus subsp. azureus]